MLFESRILKLTLHINHANGLKEFQVKLNNLHVQTFLISFTFIKQSNLTYFTSRKTWFVIKF
jgi:hypothetical protein